MGYFKLLKLKIIRFRQLSVPERRLLTLAFGLLPGLAFSLKWRGLARTQKMLTRFPFRPKNPTRPNPLWERASARDFSTTTEANLNGIALEPGISPEKIVWIVQVATRYQPAWANCLNQSVLLWWLLQRQNIESDLRFGVRHANETGRFEAHAWVEYQGEVLNDRADVGQRFAPFIQPGN